MFLKLIFAYMYTIVLYNNLAKLSTCVLHSFARVLRFAQLCACFSRLFVFFQTVLYVFVFLYVFQRRRLGKNHESGAGLNNNRTYRY